MIVRVQLRFDTRKRRVSTQITRPDGSRSRIWALDGCKDNAEMSGFLAGLIGYHCCCDGDPFEVLEEIHGGSGDFKHVFCWENPSAKLGEQVGKATEYGSQPV